MAVTEKTALWRTLNAAREIYLALSNGAAENGSALLDSISAALSHCQNEKKPLSKCLTQLKRELKHSDSFLYRKIKPYFSKLRPPTEYDFEKAAKHLPAIIYANDIMCRKIADGENDKLKTMADAMKSYPNFLFGEFSALSDSQFFDLVFGFYPKLYDEPFMEEMETLFK